MDDDIKVNLSISPHAIDRFSLRGGITKWNVEARKNEGFFSFLKRITLDAINKYNEQNWTPCDLNDVQVTWGGWLFSFRLKYNPSDMRVQQWSLRTCVQLKEMKGCEKNVDVVVEEED